MATVTPVNTKSITMDPGTVMTWNLTGRTTTDTFNALEQYGYSDRSIQFEGTFGGATVALQGSNDGSNFRTLTDPQGNALSFTAAGIKQINEITRYLRCVVTAGTSTSVIGTVLANS